MRVGKILPQVKNILGPCYFITYSTFGMCSKSIFEKSCESARPIIYRLVVLIILYLVLYILILQ